MQVPLTSGAYQARSIIASAQRQINLFTEVNQFQRYAYFPQQTTANLTTLYPTCGLTLKAQGPNFAVRCLYRTSQNQLFAVIGGGVYSVSTSFNLTLLGSIGVGTGIVSIADNGVTAVLVDGTTAGYTITLATLAFAPLVDPTGTFVGATRVDYIDGYFTFNSPGLPIWYCSLANGTTFDPLYFASKSGYPDPIQTAIVMHREIWLLGKQTSEVWFDAGATDFPFQVVNGAFLDHGCAAPHSVARYDVDLFWLATDAYGHATVVQGSNYNCTRISTHAIEHAISRYATIDDAIGFIYQHEGHVFYVLQFPSADATWVYDLSVLPNGIWHEWASADADGNLHRHRSNCAAYWNGMNLVGDYENGAIYQLDPQAFTDNGVPIQRIRSFPHLLNEMKRVRFDRFVADMSVGNGVATASQALGEQATVFLRWSNDRGATFGEPIGQPMGDQGQKAVTVQWRRCGMARDRVFELSWSSPYETALNGAFVDVEAGAS